MGEAVGTDREQEQRRSSLSVGPALVPRCLRSAVDRASGGTRKENTVVFEAGSQHTLSKVCSRYSGLKYF